MLSPFINTRLRIVVARPGARGDFVAGWLGTLPNSIDTLWRIDIETGRSLGLMTCFKHIDTEQPDPECLDRVLASRNYKIDSTAKWVFNMACHGYELEKKIDRPQLVEILQITDSSHQDKINWEYTVKTWFSNDRQEHNVRDNEFNQADRTCAGMTDYEQQQLIKQFSRSCAAVNVDQTLSGLTVTKVEYDKLFRPGGSRYLARSLGIDCDNQYHVLWNTQLYFADSRQSYNRFGTTWTQRNYQT